ncbi:MAG: alcohol dehydrogenase catalytic domain-containing protein [Deinococcota bacterium]
MKAVIYTHYGPPRVLHLTDIPKPTPRNSEVLVKVRATTVTIGNTIIRSMNLPVSGVQKLLARLYLGIHKPKQQILGMELVGDIEAVGSNVTRFKPGNAVFASLNMLLLLSLRPYT